MILESKSSQTYLWSHSHVSALQHHRPWSSQARHHGIAAWMLQSSKAMSSGHSPPKSQEHAKARAQHMPPHTCKAIGTRVTRFTAIQYEQASVSTADSYISHESPFLPPDISTKCQSSAFAVKANHHRRISSRLPRIMAPRQKAARCLRHPLAY